MGFGGGSQTASESPDLRELTLMAASPRPRGNESLSEAVRSLRYYFHKWVDPSLIGRAEFIWSKV